MYNYTAGEVSLPGDRGNTLCCCFFRISTDQHTQTAVNHVAGLPSMLFAEHGVTELAIHVLSGLRWRGRGSVGRLSVFDLICPRSICRSYPDSILCITCVTSRTRTSPFFVYHYEGWKSLGTRLSDCHCVGHSNASIC